MVKTAAVKTKNWRGPSDVYCIIKYIDAEALQGVCLFLKNAKHYSSKRRTTYNVRRSSLYVQAGYSWFDFKIK